MKIFVSSHPDSMGKFVSMVQAFPKIWNGRILDVGCRSGQLRDALPKKNGGYLGLDLSPPASVVGNLGIGLPFEAESSDTVVALDVLEHTDDIYRSFSELCRVAHSYVLIVLPNVYEIKGRARFLFGRRLSGKYGLPQDPPSDRHRWLFSLPEAVNFAHTMGQRCGFEVVDEGCLIGPWRSVMGVRQLVSFFPNLLSPSYVALLHRKETNESKQWNIQLH